MATGFLRWRTVLEGLLKNPLHQQFSEALFYSSLGFEHIIFLRTVCLPLGTELFALPVFHINYLPTPPWPLLVKQLGMLQKPKASHKLTRGGRGRKMKSPNNMPCFSACPYPQILHCDCNSRYSFYYLMIHSPAHLQLILGSHHLVK